MFRTKINTMKKIIVVLLISGLWGCTQRDYVVQSDKSLDTNFDQYSTYNFSTHALSEDVQFVLRDLALKVNIREAIMDEMQAKGYTLGTINPDLLVNFRVFEGATEIVGYEEESGYWTDEEVRSIEDRKTIQLDKGSLIIDLVDAESGTVVWTGYASGILEKDKFDRSEQSIATAVDMIFDDYEFRAESL
jgi:hypothetical protein